MIAVATDHLLNHWGLVTPYGDRRLCGSSNGLLPDGTKPLPEPNVNWWLVRSCDLLLRVILWEMSEASIIKIGLKITCTELHANLPGTNELKPSRNVGGPTLFGVLHLMKTMCLCSQQCGCWWPGTFRCQGICRHSNDQGWVQMWIYKFFI